MSTFAVKLTRIRAIEPIDNADAIELAVVGDYRSVVRKGEFSPRELVVYIPEQSILPDWLIKTLGLEGKLSGSDKNRVKAVKLRGCLSQGLCLPVRQLKATTASVVYDAEGSTQVFSEGDDVASFMGIKKYEPVIPQQFAGEQYGAFELTVHYDIENYKAFPDVLVEGEEVVFTEKLHGTFCGVGIVPEKDASSKHWLDRCVVFSKGLGAQGVCLLNSENNLGNAYIRALQRLDVFNKLINMIGWYQSEQNETLNEPLFLLGEVYGPGIQDALFTYGHNETHFRIFDIVSGYRGQQEYYDYNFHESFASIAGLDLVPLLYRGPFSREKLLEYTSGTTTLGEHIREGVVARPVVERHHPELGRVILKSVSEAYLLRKNGTEFN